MSSLANDCKNWVLKHGDSAAGALEDACCHEYESYLSLQRLISRVRDEHKQLQSQLADLQRDVQPECHHIGKVYWNAESSNYYCADCKKGMGVQYFRVAQELEAAKRELESLKAKAGWVSVEDRLPEIAMSNYSAWVLVCDSFKIVYEAHYHHSKKKWLSANDVWQSSEIVTHWRELPQPPTMETTIHTEK